VFDQTNLKKDTVERERVRKPLLQMQTEETPLQRLSRETPYMPSKKKSPDKGRNF
jgi:hypothetical protein